MYLRAGIFSFALLLLSRVIGLARESVQAAAFGSTCMADVVIFMFTLPDLLVGIFLSGVLAYVLLPYWAGQSVAEQNISQKKVAGKLLASGLLLSLVIWFLQDALVQALAPSLKGAMKTLGASSLGWSAAVFPLAMLAALWVTRLQHARDFIGMYAGNLLVNGLLVAALLLVAGGYLTAGATFGLGLFLVLAMFARLAWLGWRLRSVRTFLQLRLRLPTNQKIPRCRAPTSGFGPACLRACCCCCPWWVAASLRGEGALANFNYRMSNVLAGIGRGQLRVLEQRVEPRRRVFARYVLALADQPQIHWMQQPDGYHFTRWLTCSNLSRTDADQRCHQVTKALERHLIEAMPAWKPMHMQKLFNNAPYFSHGPRTDVAAERLRSGICLPSGSNLSGSQQDRVIHHLRHILVTMEDRRAFA